ncbi:hypothetical protein PIB30_094088 [Stylosanthes scabra]|uniref:AT-hook motif nuclear-localized protein n=1 Tax=Stylosanthes scabra TaxID=79078 RepID=A0ABU6QXT7_9FABA|nr:hypothetical protein [Stylosanthes scabra]
MDRGDQMALSASASYYMQTGLHNSPTITVRPTPMSNPNLPFQSTIGSTMPLDSSGISSHCVNVGGEPLKRKRGRPRKYGPDGTVSLALTPTPATHPGTITQAPHKRGRGRPPGSGKKQQLASLGELMSGTAGMGFTPHIITVAVGEDIATKVMAFSQQGPRAICIMAATGAVSTVTLGQPSTSGGSVTYEGRFEILCLSGSYLLTDSGGSRNRSGGLSVSLASPDGRVIGGGVGGVLIAASPVQVVVGSFVWGGPKAKKQKKEASSEGGEVAMETVTMNNISPVTPWPTSRPMDMRHSHIDIDLMRG